MSQQVHPCGRAERGSGWERERREVRERMVRERMVRERTVKEREVRSDLDDLIGLTKAT